MSGSAPRVPSKPTTAEALLTHISELASDRYEGRSPGTNGEALTIAYLEKALRGIGLEGAFGEGSFTQAVPLVGITSQGDVALRGRKRDLPFRRAEDFVVVSRKETPKIDVLHSPLVFVGYGVKAKELNWDDFKGVDLHGKTLVVLINDPPPTAPASPSSEPGKEPLSFGGNGMTYYGRWTYKYEVGAELGAAGVLIIHEEGRAGYPWGVVRGWGRENFVLASEGAPRLGFEGWLSATAGKQLLEACGTDLETLRRAAARRDFRPVPLDGEISVHVNNVLRPVLSHNVAGVLEGGEPAKRAESILYSAHWDHLGRDSTSSGDGISNGAVDNASGVAEVLEIGRELHDATPAPRRSFVFLFPTAEESGLLGAKYYAAHPARPVETTLADINLDMMNVWGKTSSIISVAHGTTSLDELLVEAAKKQSRTVKSDPDPEKGYFFRTDAFELSRAGVPSLSFLRPGADYVGKPAGFDKLKAAEFIENDYHRVTDEVHSDWDMTGAVDDVHLLASVGRALDRSDTFPQWKAAAAIAKGGGIRVTERKPAAGTPAK